MSLPIDAPLKLAFRCDSSSHRGARYMVAGGVALQPKRYADISAAIGGIKEAAGITSESKWSKFRGGERTSGYKAVIDLFYSLLDINQIHFHCMIAEFGKFSHKAFPSGGPETSVNKMYSQIIIHRICRIYAKRCYIFVYPDKGNDSRDLPRFQGWINWAAHDRYGVEHRLCLIEPTNSEKCDILQMVDVIIGGIAYRCNFHGSGIANVAPHKAELAAYILSKAQRETWLRNTAPNARRMTVWNFRHQKISSEAVPQGARRYSRQG